MASKLAPMFLVTAAQTNLLLAEARNNNWVSSGTTLGYFNAGITEAMRQLALYGSGSTVAASDINTYVASRATAFAANPVKEINYEYWVASFLNGQEAWANFLQKFVNGYCNG